MCDQVRPRFACPSCGEDHVDKLVWVDHGESVVCTFCGAHYKPAAQSHYYAVEYAYGALAVNDGNRADKVVRFGSRFARDAWVSEGPADISAQSAREAITAKSARLAASQFYDAADPDVAIPWKTHN